MQSVFKRRFFSLGTTVFLLERFSQCTKEINSRKLGHTRIQREVGSTETDLTEVLGKYDMGSKTSLLNQTRDGRHQKPRFVWAAWTREPNLLFKVNPIS